MIKKLVASKIFLELHHRLMVLMWKSRFSRSELDFLGEAWISCFSHYHTEFDPIRSYILMFELMRQNGFKGQLLELGGGYSTVVARAFFSSRDVQIFSVDINPSKYRNILNGRINANRFLKKIHPINQLSVSLDEANRGVSELVDVLLKYPQEALNEALNEFNSSIRFDAFSRQSLLNLFFFHPNYCSDLSFYESQDNKAPQSFCQNVLMASNVYDAIFFDCGELSSCGEWMMLKDSVSIGGYVMLHDIFYPKSIKNFLVAASLRLSSDWEIIFIDKSSPQGALLARRLN